jgi:type VI secretion system secreted protein Hcp
MVRKAGGKQEQYLKITLENVLVSSYSVGGTQGSNTVPFDQFALTYGKITFSYAAQKPDGSLDIPVTFTGATSGRMSRRE